MGDGFMLTCAPREEIHSVDFHMTSFSEKPFFRMGIGTKNSLQQVVPEGIVQSQPRLGLHPQPWNWWASCLTMMDV